PVARDVEGAARPGVEEADDRADDVVLVHKLELLVDPVQDREEGRFLQRALDVVVDVRAEDDARPDDRHHSIATLQGPQLAGPVALPLVTRARDVARAPRR